MTRPLPPAEIAALQEALASVSTATAADILKPHTPERFVMRDVRPLLPVSKSVSGPVRTLRYLPGRSDVAPASGPNLRVRQIDSLNPGDVLVCDQIRGFGGPMFGDMVALRAFRNGAAAVVTDGPMRDVAGIAEVGLPVFATGTWPVPNAAALIPWEVDVPIQCGGALVLPGDWVLADNEAVMVIPKGYVQFLVERVPTVMQEEMFCRLLLERGHRLEDVFPMPSKLRVFYERYLRTRDLPSDEEVKSGGA